MFYVCYPGNCPFYRGGHAFCYTGDDQYFGSWQGKDIGVWNYLIKELRKQHDLPVPINEWGYSSGSHTEDVQAAYEAARETIARLYPT